MVRIPSIHRKCVSRRCASDPERLRHHRQRRIDAADDGEESGIDDVQVVVVPRLGRSSGDVAGSLPKRTVPHWCRRPWSRTGARRRTGNRWRADFLALLAFRLASASGLIAPSGRIVTRLSGCGRSSLCAYQSTLRRADRVRIGCRPAPRCIGGSCRAVCRLPGVYRLAFAEAVVVHRDRLREMRRVRLERMHRHQRTGVVRRSCYARPVGAVGQPARVARIGRTQQQRGGLMAPALKTNTSAVIRSTLPSISTSAATMRRPLCRRSVSGPARRFFSSTLADAVAGRISF